MQGLLIRSIYNEFHHYGGGKYKLIQDTIDVTYNITEDLTFATLQVRPD